MSDPTNRPDAREPLFAYRDAQHDFKIRPESSALVLVDLQYGSASATHGFGAIYERLGYGDVLKNYVHRVNSVVIPAVQRLQSAFRDVGAPVIFVTLGTIAGDLSDMPPRFKRAVAHWERLGLPGAYARVGTRDIEVLDEIAPREGEPVIVKTSASAFTSSPLERLLWNRRVREIVFCGVATAYCVESTLRDAADRGFDVLLVEDGSADVTDEIHQRGVKGCAAFGRVATSTDVVAELAGSRHLAGAAR
jgi:nicotinamidase-related amidase